MNDLTLRGLRKEFPGHDGTDSVVAVSNANLEVPKGTLVTLLGPSGCGKSTLLRMIAGLESVDGGSIAIGDRVVNDVAPRDRDIAMVFQNYALYPHMTVAGNLAFGLKLRGMDKAAIAARVDEAAKMLGLEDMLQRRPAALSGGQRQRVALGRALVRQPQVFLLDEPLSNLDARLRAAMRVEIARLHRSLGTTMVYVTHDQVEAMTLADRIVIMQKGKVVETGPARAVLDTPEHPYSRLLKASVLSAEDAGAGKLGPAPELMALSDRLLGASESRLEPRNDGRAVRVYSQLPAA